MGLDTVTRESVEVHERFVDGVDLNFGRELAQRLRHPPTHVAVQRIVGAEQRHAPLGFWRDLVERHAHRDQRFNLVATSDYAAVVVGEDPDRLALQVGAEGSFAADVEVVAVD